MALFFWVDGWCGCLIVLIAFVVYKPMIYICSNWVVFHKSIQHFLNKIVLKNWDIQIQVLNLLVKLSLKIGLMVWSVKMRSQISWSCNLAFQFEAPNIGQFEMPNEIMFPSQFEVVIWLVKLNFKVKFSNWMPKLVS